MRSIKLEDHWLEFVLTEDKSSIQVGNQQLTNDDITRERDNHVRLINDDITFKVAASWNDI